MNIIIKDVVDSTNDYAKNEALSRDKSFMVFAKEQSCGRGTRGKSWYSEKDKNIIMSIVYYPIKEVTQIDNLSVTIGEIVCNYLRSKFNLNVKTKAPNDILINDKKLCGILIETNILENKLKHVVIGIGMNVNQTIFNEEIKDIATSLFNETKKENNPIDMSKEIYEEITNYFIKEFN
ncbi:MAG: biotin--[acetyl-CoA-carboxylase] ligase [Bacilli bacterium]|nr:biotin--[acetyl-CoA-carboxylase] ligase [Bacilli bacterium]MDD4809224.1 biotin--[acetyl-CoA-carboxylase] ligase [Bacilli bacterium]